MGRLIEVPQEIWLKQFRKSEASRFGSAPQPDSNLFFSLQLMGKDLEKKRLAAWAWIHDDQEVGWLATCYNAEDVVRLRGIVVKAEHRRKGFGQKMISEAMLRHPDARKFLLFCSEGSCSYYRRLGFEVAPEFIPRPVETYDEESGEYKVICHEKLLLMENCPNDL